MVLESFGRYTNGVDPIMSRTVVFLIYRDFLNFLYNIPTKPADTTADIMAIMGFDRAKLKVIYYLVLFILFSFIIDLFCQF